MTFPTGKASGGGSDIAGKRNIVSHTEVTAASIGISAAVDVVTIRGSGYISQIQAVVTNTTGINFNTDDVGIEVFVDGKTTLSFYSGNPAKFLMMPTQGNTFSAGGSSPTLTPSLTIHSPIPFNSSAIVRFRNTDVTNGTVTGSVSVVALVN